eukprot:g5835.t1
MFSFLAFRWLVFSLFFSGSLTYLHRTPVVVVPGLGGSVLEARLSGRPPSEKCKTDSGGHWFTLWADPEQFLFRYHCFVQNLQLHANKSTPVTVSNLEGVNIRPRDYGGTAGIEFSNAGTKEPQVNYMHKLVDAFVASGYERGVSIRAATNDFRAVGLPNVLHRYYSNLTDLVEETFKINNNTKVHLLSHSLGGPLANLFLTSAVNKTWKDRFIASHIMISCPLMGTPIAMYAAFMGPRNPEVLEKVVHWAMGQPV